MTAEHDYRRIPEWAQGERVGDQAWIAENLSVFQPAAQTAFTEQGRGALVVDTTSRPTGKATPSRMRRKSSLTSTAMKIPSAWCESTIRSGSLC
jgi:hypothetical protein